VIPWFRAYHNKGYGYRGLRASGFGCVKIVLVLSDGDGDGDIGFGVFAAVYQNDNVRRPG